MTEKSWADNLAENYKYIKERFDEAVLKSGRKEGEVTLLAATKTVSPEIINAAIGLGVTHIGENRVQEFLSKEEQVRRDVHRHFIGHLQTNKVKDIVGKVEMIQSVHSLKLASEIGKQSLKMGIITDVLAEVNIGNEESKSGFSPESIAQEIEKMGQIEGIRVKGLMSIPPICETRSEIHTYFTNLRKLFIDIKAKTLDNVNMEILSMGMSDDFDVAIECGSNMVRIGTALFGKRM